MEVSSSVTTCSPAPHLLLAKLSVHRLLLPSPLLVAHSALRHSGWEVPLRRPFVRRSASLPKCIVPPKLRMVLTFCHHCPQLNRFLTAPITH